MASEKQQDFFATLVSERKFPEGSPDSETLTAQFAPLPEKSASEWIEKALTLPIKDAVAPPF
jgi:hypothetical protein